MNECFELNKAIIKNMNNNNVNNDHRQNDRIENCILDTI
jgi:hypothetical protein